MEKLFREKVNVSYLNNPIFTITKETSKELFVENTAWNMKRVYELYPLLDTYLKAHTSFKDIVSYLYNDEKGYTCFMTEFEVGEKKSRSRVSLAKRESRYRLPCGKR